MSVKGIISFSTVIIFLAGAGCFVVGIIVSPCFEFYVQTYLLIIRENTVVVIMLFLWMMGHLIFLGKANLQFDDVDYTEVFPVYQLVVFVFGMALPIARGFDAALPVAARVAMIVLGISIVFDTQFPGFLGASASRGAGFALNANLSAFSICLMFALVGMSAKFLLLNIFTVCVAFTAIFFTFSRSGLAQFGIVFIIYALLSGVNAWRTGRIGSFVGLVGAVVALAVLVGVLDQVVESMPIFQEGGVSERLDSIFFRGGASITEDHYRPALNSYYLGLALEHPLLGYGTYYTNGAGLGLAPFGVGPHNMYLRAWVELGIWGLFTYVGILISAMWLVLRRRCVPGQVVILIAALYGFFSHNLIDNKAFLIELGIVLGMSVIKRQVRPVAEIRV